MARARSSARKPWQAVLEFKRELASRDPLGVGLTRLLIDYWSSTDERLWARIERLRDKITSKYEFERLDLPQPPLSPTLLRASGLSEADVGGILWSPLGLGSPISRSTNWALPGQIVLVGRDGGTQVILPEQRPAPPPGHAKVTVTVRLAGVTHWDIARAEKDFEDAVRGAVKSLPTHWGAPRSVVGSEPANRVRFAADERHLVALVVFLRRRPVRMKALSAAFRQALRRALKTRPRQKSVRVLAFLWTTSAKKFSRDLRRYDLYVNDRVSCRAIALQEAAERAGQPISPQRLRRVGWSVSGEESVADSVQRVFRAIHRRALPARFRRHPETLAPYSCAEHGQRCPPECLTLQEFRRRVTLQLPSDTTGALPPKVRRQLAAELVDGTRHKRPLGPESTNRH